MLSSTTSAEKPSKLGHRIDSPLHQNAKPLPNSDLLQATNATYKPAYKQNRKITSNEVQKLYPDLVGIVAVWPEHTCPLRRQD